LAADPAGRDARKVFSALDDAETSINTTTLDRAGRLAGTQELVAAEPHSAALIETVQRSGEPFTLLGVSLAVFVAPLVEQGIKYALRYAMGSSMDEGDNSLLEGIGRRVGGLVTESASLPDAEEEDELETPGDWARYQERQGRTRYIVKKLTSELQKVKDAVNRISGDMGYIARLMEGILHEQQYRPVEKFIKRVQVDFDLLVRHLKTTPGSKQEQLSLASFMEDVSTHKYLRSILDVHDALVGNSYTGMTSQRSLLSSMAAKLRDAGRSEMAVAAGLMKYLQQLVLVQTQACVVVAAAAGAAAARQALELGLSAEEVAKAAAKASTAADGDGWSNMDFLRVSVDDVRNNFNAVQVSLDNVHFVKGFFQKSLPTLRD